MSELLCIEPVGGIAGDMFLALCFDLGMPRAELEAQLALLPLSGYRLEVSRSMRHEIEGTHLDVVIDEPVHGHAHRAWSDIRELIRGSKLSERIKERALGIFGRIAIAEAHVHAVDVEKVHFHEVGAVDSIVDVVGAAIAVELLGAPEIYCTPPPMGSGLIKSAHGMTPIPPPATLEILKERPVKFEGVGELTTPTGAALVAALTREESFPPLRVERVGYGVGTKDFRDRPNVLRGLLARRAEKQSSELLVLEANLDDATPQLLAWALDAALAAGALDAWIAPLTMKKGRPGHLLGVLVSGEKREALTAVLLRETPTLGVRAHAVERAESARRFETVQTAYGPVRVKIGSVQGRDTNATPEYEDCARLAREKSVPLKEVIAAAVAALRSGGK